LLTAFIVNDADGVAIVLCLCKKIKGTVNIVNLQLVKILTTPPTGTTGIPLDQPRFKTDTEQCLAH
jgi:hypothetical protein